MSISDVCLLYWTAYAIVAAALAICWAISFAHRLNERLDRIEWILAADYGEPSEPPDPDGGEPIDDETETNVIAFGRRSA